MNTNITVILPVHQLDEQTKPLFDNAVKRSTKPTKDKFGNVIKNRARSLARASARKNMDTLNPSTKEKK